MSKKIVLCFLLILLSAFNFKFNVYADTTSTEEGKGGNSTLDIPYAEPYNADTYGRYTDGEVPSDMRFKPEQNENGVITRGDILCHISGLSFYRIHCVDIAADGGIYLTYHPDATDCSGFFQLHGVGNTYDYTRGVLVKDSTYPEGYLTSGSRPFETNPIGYAQMPFPSYSIDFISTNIPIFDPNDKEGIEKYLNQGDHSGAINADDVDNSVDDGSDEDGEYSSDIEKPRGVQCVGTFSADWNDGLLIFLKLNSDIKLSWYYPAEWEEYKYDIQFRANYETRKGFKNGKWYSPENYIGIYGEATTLDGSPVDYSVCRTSFPMNVTMQNKYFAEPVKDDNDIVKVKTIEFRVRNRKGNKYSDWVVVSTDGKSSSAHVEDDEGNVKDDDEYDGGSVTPEDPNDTNGDTDISSNVSNILAFIRDGFGLLGNGGVISLMSRCFLYLPASIWTMIKFLVAMMVLMSVISLIKKFVF